MPEAKGSVSFYFNGRPVTGRRGVSIASALMAKGVTVLNRSMKYHRPRGLYCAVGKCGRCVMRVDGVPNVRTCVTPVRPGMRVLCERGFPSADHDILSLLDKMSRFFTAGFQYKRFIRPRTLVPFYQEVTRYLAGLGRPPDEDVSQGAPPTLSRAEFDVTIVGGGPAGLCAANAASQLDLKVALIEEDAALGGHLRSEPGILFESGEFADKSGFQIIEQLRDRIAERKNLSIFPGSVAFGLYEGNILAVAQASHLLQVRSERFVLTTGAYEYPPLFGNNDLPGIMGGRAVQRLLHLEETRPGDEAAILGPLNGALKMAGQLEKAGIKVQAIITPEEARENVRGFRVFAQSFVQEAYGQRRLKGINVASTRNGNDHGVPCDLLCIVGNTHPTYELQYQAGCHIEYDEALGAYVTQHNELMQTSNPCVYVAGEAAGCREAAGLMLQGKLAGLSAARSLRQTGESAEIEQVTSELKSTVSPVATAFPLPSGRGKAKQIVCFCEDVTASEIVDSIHEGYNDPESLKRYTGVSMGICQGKYCLTRMLQLLARETGATMRDMRLTTQRPPVSPISLGLLAGE